jgi:hypothetical protein
MLFWVVFICILVYAPILVMEMCVQSILLCMIVFASNALAFCECGYSTSIAVGPVTNTYIFTDVIESDFLHIKDVELDTDWSVQSYTVSASSARGPYG